MKPHRISQILFTGLLLVTACSPVKPPPPRLMRVNIVDQNGFSQTINAKERLKKYENVDFYKPQSYKKVLRVYKVDDQGNIPAVLTLYHTNGSIAQYLEIQNSRAFGKYREWYPSGQLKLAAEVLGGVADVNPAAQNTWVFDGESKAYTESGQLLAKIPYCKGVLEGEALHLWPSGQIKHVITYKNNLMEGTFRSYYSDGNKQKEAFYRKGLLDGETKLFFSTGTVAGVEEYVKGRLIHAQYYTQDGETIAKVVAGFGDKIVYSNETSYEKFSIKNGQPEGLIEEYENHTLKRSYHLKEGLMHGRETLYFSSEETEENQPKISIDWNRGNIHGTVTTWFLSGQKESQKEFTRNKKTGLAISWYEDGKVMLIEEYSADVLVKGSYYNKSNSNPLSTVLDGCGVASLFDNTGMLVKKISYKNGIPTS